MEAAARRAFTPDALSAAVARREPVVFGGAALAWPAITRWAGGGLCERTNGQLGRVYRQEHSHIFSYESAPEENVPTSRARYSDDDPPRREVNMTCAEFVRWAESDAAHQCYVSWDFPGPDDIPNDGLDRLAEDIPSLPEFAINETDSGTPNSAVWMGARRVVAQSHYDIQHNIFAQLRGEKTFVVAPPSEALAYRLFPEAHVRSRQSQLEALPTTAAPLREAHLRPGDVLYLPPLWLHRVTAGAELSVSVNRFQDSRENAGARALVRAGLPPALRKPRKDDLPFPSRVALLALWLRFLLHRACGGAPSATAADAAAAAAATVLHPHLESRFGLLHERIGCASWAPSLCPPRAELSPSLVDEARAHAEAAAAALDEWLPAGRCGARREDDSCAADAAAADDAARRELLLQQHAELTGRAVVGVPQLCGFLRCLALGAETWAT